MLRSRLLPLPWLAVGVLLGACDPLPGDTEGAGSGTATDGATSVVPPGTGDDTAGGETVDPSATSTAGMGGGGCQPLPHDGDPCAVDADCAIAGDCCSCVAYNPGMSSPGNCGGGCEQDVCERLGLVDAVCEAGTCRVRGLSCDQTAVLCDAAPPACPAGELPQVADQCFTGACLPVAYCDWVPDCSHCPADELCVITKTEACEQHACLPPLPECPAGPATCDCLGQLACEAPYDTCAIDGDAIVCS